MHTNLTIDEAGRITLPDAIRAELHLNPGDTLEAITSGNGVILRPAGSFYQKDGIWVLETGTPITAEETERVRQQIYLERDLANLGLFE